MIPEEPPISFHPRPSDTPAFKDILLVYLVSSLLLIVAGSALQHAHLFAGLIITEVAFVVAPPLLYTWYRRYSIARTFHVVPIGVKTILLAIITTIAAFLLVAMLAVLQELIFPRSADYQEVWETILHEFHQLPLALTLLIVSILPGICEELLFRGFLLHGMRKRMAVFPAVTLVGVLFGAFHLDPYRFVPVSLLGILFGYMVVKTGSIFTGIVAHSTNNAIAILLSSLASRMGDSQPELTRLASESTPSLQDVLAFLPMAAIALFVLVIGLRALPENRETDSTTARNYL